MYHPWIQEYLFLALRTQKVTAQVTDIPLVNAYYGPPAWKAVVEAESMMKASDLVRDAQTLAETLPAQHFEERRARYLAKQVVALETICRLLDGEAFALEEVVQRCFDIRPTWLPETQFEEALALYKEALPGKGPVPARLHAWRRQQLLYWHPQEQILETLRQVTAEARRRTQALVALPETESIDIQLVTEKSFAAHQVYLGNYQSRLDINTDAPLPFYSFIDLMCHESYPGHHVEAVMKEQCLYRERGYTEEGVFLLLSPQSLVSEGIAMLGREAIFAPAEIEHLVSERLSLDVELTEGEKLQRAIDLLAGVQCNAAFLFHQGSPAHEVEDYLRSYMMPADLTWLKDPFWRIYLFSYYYGKHLVQPWLQGPDRLANLRRLLTEQITPSELAEESSSPTPKTT